MSIYASLAEYKVDIWAAQASRSLCLEKTLESHVSAELTDKLNTEGLNDMQRTCVISHFLLSLAFSKAQT